MVSTYLKVDSSPLDAFLEKMSLSILRTESETVKLREENANLQKEVASVMSYDAEISKLRDEKLLLRRELTEKQAADNQNMTTQMIQLVGKVQSFTDQLKVVHHMSEQLRTVENKLEVKAEIHSVAELRDQIFGLSRTSQDLANNVSAFKSETNRNSKEIKAHICSVSDQMMEQVAILNKSKANKSDAVQGTTVDSSWVQSFEQTRKACDQNTSELQALNENLSRHRSRTEEDLSHTVTKEEFRNLESKVGLFREECSDILKAQSKQFLEQFRRTENQMQYNLEKIDEIETKAEQSVNICKKNTADLVENRKMNKDFIFRSEQEIAKKVGMDAVLMLLKDKATKNDCAEIVQSFNQDLNEKLIRCNRFIQNMREDVDVLLTMIMQDVHNSQSNDAKSTALGSVRCISCCRPVATPRRRMLLKSLSVAPSRAASASPTSFRGPTTTMPVAETSAGTDSPPQQTRSSSAFGKW
jgi:hypothetical protein